MTRSLAELKQIGIFNALRGCSIFAGMPSAALIAIANTTVSKTVAKGEFLFREGQPSVGFYIIQAGAINVHRVNSAGREQVVHVFRAGESFAEGTLAIDAGYPADARAVEATRVLLVQKTGILALLRKQPELAMRMLGSLSAHLRILVCQLDDLTLKNVETRLASWLLKKCPDPSTKKPVRIKLSMTKRVLAAELGTVGETLSRTLAKFREQGLVNVERSVVTVLSPAKLRTLIQWHLGEVPPKFVCKT